MNGEGKQFLKNSRIYFPKDRLLIKEKGGLKISLEDYPGIDRMMRNSEDLRIALEILPRLYQDRRRVSGRLFIRHCLETAEVASLYTSDSWHLIVAIYHDLMEDMGVSFETLKEIAGCHGEKVANTVVVLSKKGNFKNKKDRNQEYMVRIAKAIEEDPSVGIVKLSDRRSNLTDIQSLPTARRLRIARQTIDFYVPIALRLNLWELARQLIDLSIPHAAPNQEESIWREI